jgi:hypothetical protein
MRLGKPVVLEAVKTRSGELQLTVNTLEAATATGSALTPNSGESKKAAGSSAQVWASLGSGLKITEQPEDPAKATASTSREGASLAENVRIAVFCPDGTAIAAGPTYLSDGETTFAVTVNQWIGGAVFAVYSAETALSDEREEDRPKQDAAPAPTGPQPKGPR